MSRKKLIRYQENSENPLIIQIEKDSFVDVQKNRESFFWNKNPIVLELACGKWEYSTGLAAHFPDKNFIWVDIKWNRLRYWAQTAKENNLKNVWFIRDIVQNIWIFFKEKSIEEIWLVHPDPRPKNADAHRRLTHPRFLSLYQNLLKKWWLLKLKTDDLDLFDYSIETLKSEWWTILDSTKDLYNSHLLSDHFDIKTYYENHFYQQWRNICYLKAKKD